MAELTDVDLLSRLQVALAPLPSLPDDECMARLHATLAELALEDRSANLIPFVQPRAVARHSDKTRRRRFSTRSTVFVASALSFALTAGVAAAAVATNTLPGPTRAIASDLGLPVTSPSLFHAQQLASQLGKSITAKDRLEEKQSGRQLIDAMKTLDSHDLSQIQRAADTLLVEAGLSLPTLSNSVTPVTVPSAPLPPSKISRGVSKVTVPTVTIPKTTVPSGKVPTVTVPTTPPPSVTVPTVNVPSATVPPVTIPKTTLPTLKVPGAT